jgi:hypothetical protein
MLKLLDILHFIKILFVSYLSNKYLRQYHSQHSVEQEVEWLYAFDVHANSFFCSFFVTYVLQVYLILFLVILQVMNLFYHYVFQYFLLPILLGRSALSCLVSNTLYAMATAWYFYITYLGYRSKLSVYFSLYVCHYISLCKILRSTTIFGKRPSFSLVSCRGYRFLMATFNNVTSSWFKIELNKNYNDISLWVVKRYIYMSN